MTSPGTQPLTTLRASKACRGENFTFTFKSRYFCVFSVVGRMSLDVENLYNLFRVNNAVDEAHVTGMTMIL
jgi:hypothetical protein